MIFFLQRRGLAVGFFLSVLVGLTWLMRVVILLSLLVRLIHLIAALSLIAWCKMSLLPLLNVIVLIALDKSVEITS